jgi:hypothetical protein
MRGKSKGWICRRRRSNASAIASARSPQLVRLRLAPRRDYPPPPGASHRTGIRKQRLPCGGPADHLPHVFAHGWIKRILPTIGLSDQMERPQFHHGMVGTRRFSDGEQARRQTVEPCGERRSLGVDQPLRHLSAGARSISGKGDDAPLQLIGQPAIELIEAREDACLPRLPVALLLGGGARLGLRIAGGVLPGCRGLDRGLCRHARRRRRLGRTATTRQPFVHPVRRRQPREGELAFRAHPHQGEAVLAGKLSAWAGAFGAGVDLADDHPVRRRPRPLRLAPNQPGVVAGQCRPRAWFQQLARRVERGLIGRERLDLFYIESHSKENHYVIK